MSDAFTIYPAIDLRRGKVVRLQQGRDDNVTEYALDPVEVAASFDAAGARWIHVVNLDGAFGETGENLSVLRDICASVSATVQFGGGIRSRSDFDAAIECGANRCVLGTVAVKAPDLVAEIAHEHAKALAVGLDAHDGMVAVEGWVETSQLTVADLANRMQDVGVQTFVYTDIGRDGMLTGPDAQGTGALNTDGRTVIASGGVGNLEHVRECREAGASGVIIGKALYEERFTINDALELQA